MPRPRFQKLDPEKREAIIDAAAEEFAAHGFKGASYNAIIDAAGVSKGAMYYYFDDKADLYDTAIKHAFQRLIEGAGEVETPRGKEEFWQRVEEWSSRVVEVIRSNPSLARLFSAAMTAPADEARASAAYREMLEAGREKVAQVLALGRDLGAVRGDLPQDLLVAAVFGMGEGTDRWYASVMDTLDEEGHERYIRWAVDLMRRVLEP